MAAEDHYITDQYTQNVTVLARYGIVNPWLAAELSNLIQQRVATNVDAAYEDGRANP